MLAHERRYHQVGKPETELGCESLLRRSIPGSGARIIRNKVAMQSGSSIRRQARLIRVSIDRNRADIGNRSQRAVGVQVRRAWNRWHMIEVFKLNRLKDWPSSSTLTNLDNLSSIPSTV